MIKSHLLLKSIVISLLIVILLGCKDEPLDLTYFVLPEDEKFTGNDTLLSVTATTQEISKVRAFWQVFEIDSTGVQNQVASEEIPPSLPLGVVNDPLFGTTDIGVLWKCVTSSDANSVADTSIKYYSNYRAKVVLDIEGTHFFGDSLANNFTIYDYTGEFPSLEDSSDFEISNDLYRSDPISTGEINYVANEEDGHTEQIEIVLNEEYTGFIVSVLTTPYDTAIDFTKVSTFPFSVYIQPEIKSGNGGIQNFKVGYNSSTGYKFYSYIELECDFADPNKEGEEDSVVTKTVVRLTPNKLFNSIHNQRSDILTQSFDTTINNNNCFLQSMAGTQIEFSIDSLIPYAESIRDSDILINRAELVLPVNNDYYSEDNIYKYPERIGIRVYSDEDDLKYIFDDIRVLSEGVFDEERKAYIINLTGHILAMYVNSSHTVYEETNKNKFVLFSSPLNPSSPGTREQFEWNRIVLNSGKNDEPMHLKIIYTVKSQL